MFQFLFRCLIELTNGRVTSAFLKKFSQSRISKLIIPLYIKVFHIDQREFSPDTLSFATLHDLFIRKLKPEVRPIDEGEQVVSSPVDGVLVEYGDITADKNITVKGKIYSTKEMMGNDEALEKYLGGKYMVLYLSPSNYHRIHAPITGKVITRWTLGKKSYPVNKWGLKYGRAPLSKNYRTITEMQNGNMSVAIVKVGAMFINSIEITNDADYLDKGQEFSYFSFGSTVVLLFNKGSFEVNKELHIPSSIHLGENIGYKTNKMDL